MGPYGKYKVASVLVAIMIFWKVHDLFVKNRSVGVEGFSDSGNG